MRKFFFWLHLAMGLLAGLVILLMSVTGVLLMYEKQMMSWFDLRSLPALHAGPRLPVEQLLALAQQQNGKMPASIMIAADPAAPAQLSLGRDLVYQDPATGQLLGPGNLQARRFFRGVTDWHRWLALSDSSRPLGRAVTGWANLAFVFITVTGAYLWLPRVWTKSNLAAVALFRGGLTGRARDFNWHNVIGVWSLVPLFFIALSATVISFPWASNLVYTLTSTTLVRV
jgi:uncharacterized iron-regulated membrane protein